MKLWKTRRGLRVKQFVLELLIIDLLKDKKNRSLEAQLNHVWKSLADATEALKVEDPANPTGNDLSEFLKSVWSELSARAKDTLDLIEQSGWEALFGTLEEDEKKNEEKKSAFVRAAATIVTPTKPWLP